jgi:hypothetical protein
MACEIALAVLPMEPKTGDALFIPGHALSWFWHTSDRRLPPAGSRQLTDGLVLVF